jgi:hypothetical protein
MREGIIAIKRQRDQIAILMVRVPQAKGDFGLRMNYALIGVILISQKEACAHVGLSLIV